MNVKRLLPGSKLTMREANTMIHLSLSRTRLAFFSSAIGLLACVSTAIAADDDPKQGVDSETQRMAEQLQGIAQAFEAGKPVDFKPIAAAFVRKLQTSATDQDIGLAINAAEIGIDAGSYESAKQILSAAEKALARSNNPQAKQAIDQMVKPLLAKLAMLGTKPTIEGDLYGGGKLDWAKYKGKVVLLDFWATWCGPCMAELPNVKKAYQKYHDQGFEIVGISLDDKKDELVKFLDKEKLPWTTLFSDDPSKQGWTGAAMTKQFGVNGIPATFLFDRSGKIVSLGARGEQLDEQVKKLLSEKTSQ
jgi:peroxiredoxin